MGCSYSICQKSKQLKEFWFFYFFPSVIVGIIRAQIVTAGIIYPILVTADIMRSLFITAAFLTAVFASPYAHPESVADYIRAASNTPAEKASTGTQEPCAQISSALSITQNSTTPGQVDAKLALQCLQSVPLGAGASTQLLGLKSFLNFQSTLAYLKDPTPG